MGQRYWVIGGEYRDCRSTRSCRAPRKSPARSPIAMRARTEWQRLTFRDRLGATTRYVITQEARA